jgi:hypothetical protein
MCLFGVVCHSSSLRFSLTISGYLSLGYSTPFLSLGQSHMYPSLAAAKAAVIVVAEEIATFGLPSGICPIVFVFTGVGNGNCAVNIFPFDFYNRKPLIWLLSYHVFLTYDASIWGIALFAPLAVECFNTGSSHNLDELMVPVHKIFLLLRM